MINEQACVTDQFQEIPQDISFGNQHAFTIDVEEWFQVGVYEDIVSEKDWPSYESRVEYQLSMLLDMLENAGIKATFFTLGYVAKTNPGLVRKITAAGHELACHGLDHQRLFTLTRDTFCKTTKEAKTRLEDVTGIEVIGYRAPSFSLNSNCWWVYEELTALGFKYSSSLYPIQHDHYGMPTAPKRPFYPVETSEIIEIPMTVCRLGGRNLPASGGGYFRLMPYWLADGLFKRGVKQIQTPGIFYTHPWEYDPHQPRLKTVSIKSSFRHHVGQRGMRQKVSRFLKSHKWGTMYDVIYQPILEYVKRQP
jgi:polysaccharide deacetylase family protein (PEP-CTERM system associated)